MRSDVRDNLKGGTKRLASEVLSVEKQQEQELMNKLAANGRLPAKPQSSFLQKRLQQQRKYFDSGDYAMNKDKERHDLNKSETNPHEGYITKTKLEPVVPGSPIVPMVTPTPRVVPTTQSGPVSDSSLNVEVPQGDESLQIPRPDNVPQRKASIIYPVHSKLSPQPLIHHSAHDDVLPDP